MRFGIALVVVLSVIVGLFALGGGGLLVIRGQADQLQANITSDLKTGQSELEAANASLKLANSTRDTTKIDAAKQHFSRARTSFDSAERQVDQSVVLRGLESAPAYGHLARTRHDAVDALSAMGKALADAGLQASDLDSKLLTKSPDAQPGQLLLTVLKGAGPAIQAIHDDLKAAQAAATSVDPSIVPGAQRAAFLKARSQIGTALSAVEEMQRLLPPLVELLGGNGARTYLVEQVNPAELRPGGGFIGSYSLMQADGGSLKLAKSGNSYDIAPRVGVGQKGYVTPPGPLKEFVPTASWSFVDSNFFPDFPSNAKTAERFVDPALAKPVDGVLSIDYFVVADILSVTGPLQVPGYSVTLTADNLVSTLVSLDLQQLYAHKAILGAVSGPLLQRILTLPPSDWPKLISALEQAAAQRHLQAYFNNGAVQAEMDRFGWSGIMNPNQASDFMMDVESNLGGTKANYYVKRVFTVRLSRSGQVLHHQVLVDVWDTMPKQTPPYNNYYHGYFRLFVSGTAFGMSNNLVRPKYAGPAPPSGYRMLDGWLPAVAGLGGHKQAVFSYDTPWSPDQEGTVQMYWQKQPGTVEDEIHVTWLDEAGQASTANGKLTQDEVVNLGPNGVTMASVAAAKAQIPSLSLGSG
jgi:hypothetical protein